MAWTRAALAPVTVVAVALAVVSGGSEADPRTPAALPGLPPPFLGTAVAGSGGLTAAVDAYGDVVDLRSPGPAGRGLIDNPADRQAAGTVAADTGIVPRVSLGGGPPRPLWQADSVSQHYLAGTNVVRTAARFGRSRVVVTAAAGPRSLALSVGVEGPPGGVSGEAVRSRERSIAPFPPRGTDPVPSVSVDLVEGSGLRCWRSREPGRLLVLCGPGRAVDADEPGAAGAGLGPEDVEPMIRRAAAADRRWLARARPLGGGAPAWARALYGRSLLILRALIDRRTGAVAAGARDGWAYVWPRDAGAAALALRASGYGGEARRVSRFLVDLDLDAAARFYGDGTPVPGRGAQGDAAGWVAVAARAAGAPDRGGTTRDPASITSQSSWRDQPDYQEGDPGTYLANAVATTAADGPQTRPYGGKSARRRAVAGVAAAFGGPAGLLRRAEDPASGLDSAAAWAVRPFRLAALFPAVRRTLLALADGQTRFGITPSQRWPGVDPWSAPTAWTAWSLAALGERRDALRLLGDLRRAATAAGALPERVDATTGIPRSTTPLAWSHAFAILALRELWP